MKDERTVNRYFNFPNYVYSDSNRNIENRQIQSNNDKNSSKLSEIERKDEISKQFLPKIDLQNGSKSINQSNINLNEDQNSKQEYLINEINQLKAITKSLIDNQTEVFSKIYRINNSFRESDSQNRLNSLKIDENEGKLTKLLLNFNAFLSINEKSTMKINEIYTKIGNYIEKAEYEELKNIIYDMRINNDHKNFENKGHIENLSRKYNDMHVEFDHFQRHVHEKIQSIEKENHESYLQLEEGFIKLKDGFEGKVNERLRVFNEKLEMIENENGIEKEIRKVGFESVKLEISNQVQEMLNRINEVETSSLLIEQKYLSFSTDYVKGFNNLVSEYNSKSEIEIEKVKSTMNSHLSRQEEEISKINGYIKRKNDDFKERFFQIEKVISSFDTQMKEELMKISSVLSNLTQVERTVSEAQVKYRNESKEEIVNLNEQVKEYFTKEILNMKNENSKVIYKVKSEIRDVENKLNRLIIDENEKVDNRMKENSYKLEESKRRISEVEVVMEDLKLKKEDYIKEGVLNMKNEIEDFKSKVYESISQYHDSLKEGLMTDQALHIEILSNKLSEKNKVFLEEIEKEHKNFKSILDGRVQSQIVESEKRINSQVTKKLDVISEEFEKMKMLNIKEGEYNINTNKQKKKFENSIFDN